MLDIRRALEFITEDEQAGQKLGLGLLLLFVPIANIMVVGYEVEVARRVARGEPRPLPTWNDPGALFVEGVWLSLARYIYALPAIIALVAGLFGGMALALQAMQSSDADPWRGIGPLLLAGGACVVVGLLAYFLVFGFASPAILAEYAERGTLAACFDFRAIWRFIQCDPGQYLQLWLTEWLLGLGLVLVASVVSVAAGFIPCLGSFISLFASAAVGVIVLLVSSHLVGQLLQARRPLAPPKEA